MTAPSAIKENQEREEVLRNDQKVQQASTFFQHAQSSIDDEAGGRFAKVNPSTVIGSMPLPQYPRAATPFQSDPVGLEPPLGYSVEDLEPTGVTAYAPVEPGGPADAPSHGSGVPPHGAAMSERAGPSPLSEEQTNE
jgi:hypothetical protein